MRPNSSKVVAFISSWMALGCSGMVVLVVGFLSVLKPKVMVSLTRTRPSQIWKAGFGSLRDRVAVAAGGEAGAVGRVVGGLPDDDRVLARLEHAGAVGLVDEGACLQLGQVEGRRRSGGGDRHLHDGARVGPVAGQDGGRAVRAQVRLAGVVVVGRARGPGTRRARRCRGSASCRRTSRSRRSRRPARRAPAAASAGRRCRRRSASGR